MMKVVAPMAGISDSEFLNRVIPLGFDVATLGGYSLDEKTIEASQKIPPHVMEQQVQNQDDLQYIG